jgi:D-3-phosphoglycerate dehydrogenase
MSDVAIAEIASVADVEYLPSAQESAVLERLVAAHVLVVRSGHQVTEGWLSKAPALRAIIRAGSGTDNIAVEAARGRGVLFASLPGANAVSVAELGVAAILILLRNLFPAYTQLREGVWAKSEYIGAELQHKTVALIGFGRIGQALARRLQCFDVDLVAVRRCREQLAGWDHVRFAPLHVACAEADVVAIQVPLNAETRHLLGSAQFNSMRKQPVLVNLARYEVLDMDALQEAVRSGRVRAALIDPVSADQAAQTGRFEGPIYFLPHLGGSTFDAQRRIGTLIREQLASWGLVE